MSSLSPNVTDQVAVGQEEILNSPHVSEGPGRIASAPIPSIFSDDRGSIHRLRMASQRVNLLESKSECMRSGYLNAVPTHDFVLQGRVQVWTLTRTGTTKTIYQTGQHFCVPAYVPHILYFLEDTNIVEWYDGTFACWYYHPYRNIVNVQNSLVEANHQSSPSHYRLVRQDEDSEGPGAYKGGSFRLFWYTSAALVVGWCLGVAMSRTPSTTTSFRPRP